MNVRDDLDPPGEDVGRRLGSWMDETAPSHVPVGVVADALDRTRTVRQRPAIFVRTGIGRGSVFPAGDVRRGGRALPVLPVVATAIVALIGGLLLGRALGNRPGAGSSPAGSAGSSPTSSASSSPSIQVVRPGYGQAAALLADGRVLVVGIQETETWDPSTGDFTATGQMIAPRQRPLVNVLLNGRVLIMGGSGLASAELFDPATGRFSSTGSMSGVRPECHCGIRFLVLTHASSVLLTDGRVFVSGGSASAELYDPATGRFTTTPPVPCDASRGALTALRDGRVLVLCLNSGDVIGKGALYDPVSNAFAMTGPRTTSNMRTATLLADGRVLIAGDGLQASAQFTEIYDPATNMYRRLDAALNPTAPVAVRLIDGRVLFVESQTGADHVFSPASRAFLPVDLGVAGQTATVLDDGRVLILDGAEDGKLIDPSAFP